MDEWLNVLRQACARRSQRKVAEELGVSPSMINQALKGVYPGDLDRLKRRVEGRYLNQTVNCPILGEIPLDRCQFHQEREFAATNPQRVELYRACRSGCPHSQLEQTLTPTRGRRIQIQQLSDSPPQQEERYQLALHLAQIQRTASTPEQRIELLERELTKVAQRLNGLLWANKYNKRS